MLTILQCYTYWDRCGDLYLISHFNGFYVAYAFAYKVNKTMIQLIQLHVSWYQLHKAVLFLEKFNPYTHKHDRILIFKLYQRGNITQSSYETFLKLINVSQSCFTICIIEFCINQKYAIWSCRIYWTKSFCKMHKQIYQTNSRSTPG